MSLLMSVTGAVMSCFPRVSGDEPGPELLGDALPQFSPRERG